MSGFKVKIVTSEGTQTIGVAKSHLLIGGNEHCDIQLSGGEIAPEHLRIWSDGAHLWGQDMGTPHGTTLNGQALQPMRPVMFHEADLFKLGISDATLSFHPAQQGVVRAPAVNVPSETRGNAVSPELTEQIQALTEENQQLKHEMKELREENERRSRGSSVVDTAEEEEISAVKHNALQEIQSMKEAESRRFEVWKRESVEEIEATIISTIHQHAGRKTSKEELCEEISDALRMTLLGDKPSSRRRRRGGADSMQRALLAVVFLGILAVGTFYYVHVGSHRTPASVVYIPSPGKQQLVKPAARPNSTKNYR